MMTSCAVAAATSPPASPPTTVMGLLEEARIAHSRGHKAAAQAGSMQTLFSKARDWFMGNF